ncbi:MAG: EAL domain-containing protein [Campylobacterales bacterium]|nr:EAL domain-containing protein [Campylobacterales bacterium]
MKKQNYVRIFMLFSTLMTLCAVIVFYLIAINKAEFDVNTVSQDNLYSKANERIEYENDFFNNYKNFTKTLQYPVKKYLLKEFSKEETELLLSQSILTLDCLNQIRIMDTDFNEIIKISRKASDIKVWKQEEKINKKHRDYFKYFEHLQENELGISFMDNNVEFGKTEAQPVLRLAYKIYNDKKPLGYIIVNVSLQKFIHSLVETTLYDVWLIDAEGQLLVYSKHEFQVLGQIDIKKYKNLKELYKYEHIDKKYTFIDDHTLVVKLDGFNQEQGIALVLHTKYGHHIFNNWDKLVSGMILVLFILSLIGSYFFGTNVNKLNQKYLRSFLYDKDTNLPNKAHLLEDLLNENNQVSTIISLDNIKQLISVYGVDLTDRVINEFAREIKLMTEQLGFSKLYRIEHSQFALTYKFTNNLSELKTALRNLHNQIEQKAFTCGNGCSTHFSVTMGVSNPLDIKDGKNELQEATLALETALRRQMPIEIYSSHEHIQKQNTEKVLQWISIISRALKENLVTPYAQVIVDGSNRVKKYEALIRITEDDKVYIPYEFLEISKASRHYFELSRLMIKNVFQIMATHQYECSINISTFDITDESFTKYLVELIKEYDIGSRLTVEILESEEIEQVKLLKEFLTTVKSHGVKISIDDFGAGHSNFERILSIAQYIDYLKIDGSLIKNILTDKKSQILVKSIISFSHELGFKTIAEFVENEEIFSYLKELNIDYFQGYYFSPPIPMESIDS